MPNATFYRVIHCNHYCHRLLLNLINWSDEMNPLEKLNLMQEYLFNRTVLFDTRTKQRVVITSYSYNTNKINESTLVIEPIRMIGVKDNSYMYEPSEAYDMDLTKCFNEWFSNDPKVLFDDFDVLKIVKK